jgi:hypothetical protein
LDTIRKGEGNHRKGRDFHRRAGIADGGKNRGCKLALARSQRPVRAPGLQGRARCPAETGASGIIGCFVSAHKTADYSLHPPRRAVLREETFIRCFSWVGRIWHPAGVRPVLRPDPGVSLALHHPATVWQPSGLAKALQANNLCRELFMSLHPPGRAVLREETWLGDARLDRAFSPWICFGLGTWGVAPGWDKTGPLALGNCLQINILHQFKRRCATRMPRLPGSAG